MFCKGVSYSFFVFFVLCVFQMSLITGSAIEFFFVFFAKVSFTHTLTHILSLTHSLYI